MRLLFASVRGLWLAEHFYNGAKVQWFDDGYQLNYFRDFGHSVCAVRRLDI